MTQHKETEENKAGNFITQIIEDDLKSGKHDSIYTRFPPEPNGYLHIGHAKAIFLSFGIKEKYNGKCNLRFDDTNPVKEEEEYVESIKKDVSWLGFEWDKLCYASDYFDQLYDWAVMLIKAGNAYVDEQSGDEISRQRTTPKEAGIKSPYRDRPVEESLRLFKGMKNGEYDEGSMVLRAKIDMDSPNMHMRDPVMYRILKKSHHRTADKWNIYPNYDWAHGQSDYIEGITHSLCTLEFEVHRPLYNWFLDQITDENEPRPRQIEFARLNLTYTVMSKRKLMELVEGNYVKSWDDPRMPTISGLRRRGFTPGSLKLFSERVGLAKRENTIDVGLLEWAVREDLNKIAERRLAVMDPLKVVITNYPKGQIEDMEGVNNPEDESAGKRTIPFGRELYIEKKDFMEDPPRKFFRLAPGREVRLRYGYFITCQDVIKDDDGEIKEIHCTYDPETRGGQSPDGRKVKGTIHWVAKETALPVEIREYDRLFDVEDPTDVPENGDFKANLNPESLRTLTAYAEPSLKYAEVGKHFQFERTGYYCVDPDSTKEKLVFNRTVALRDSWSKNKSKKK
ncbi:MAG: glutamine--tRNA ligase/YqeY domain fusion protein [Bacteroidales bacterium]